MEKEERDEKCFPGGRLCMCVKMIINKLATVVSLFSHCAHSSLNLGYARCELRSWKKK